MVVLRLIGLVSASMQSIVHAKDITVYNSTVSYVQFTLHICIIFLESIEPLGPRAFLKMFVDFIILYLFFSTKEGFTRQSQIPVRTLLVKRTLDRGTGVSRLWVGGVGTDSKKWVEQGAQTHIGRVLKLDAVDFCNF